MTDTIVPPLPDLATIKRAVRVLFADEELAELRVITPASTGRGYFTDLDKLTDQAFWAAAQPASNVYVVLNRPAAELTQRADNTVAPGSATKDKEIDRRRWLLVDVDPTKPDPKSSASDQEKEHAKQLARTIVDHLRKQGFHDPVCVDSGNGVHLLYPVDLPNTREVTRAIKQLLEHLARQFNTDHATVDTSVHNAARICKLPGTVARKGEHTTERPHRTARLLHVPDCLEAVDLEQIRQAGGCTEPEPDTEPPQPSHDPLFAEKKVPAADSGDLILCEERVGAEQANAWNIPALLKQHGLEYSHQAGYDTEQGPADLYRLAECPWADEHSSGRNGAAVLQFPSGAVAFTCRHSHCQGRTWSDFRAKVLGIPDAPQVQELQVGPSYPPELDELQLDLPRPELDGSAFIGVLGEYAQIAGEYSEADPAAVLMQTATCFGVAAGRNAYFTIAGGTQHFAKLFLAVCGRTSKGRKGLSLDVSVHFMRQAYEDFQGLLRGGLSTGEGVIHAVRDPAYQVDKDGQPFLSHPGVDDKRGLFCEPEMASIFSRIRREGNTLSAILRDAWDDKVLSVTTRKDPLMATNTHLAVIAHITPEELREVLRPCDINNGLANRFLWCYAERKRLLPRGSDLPQHLVAPLIDRLREAVEFAQVPCEVDMSDDAWQLWDELYVALDGDQDDSVMEGLSSRAAPQVRRLALVLALTDCQRTVQVQHLHSAAAMFEYSRRTLEHCYISGVDAAEAKDILAQILSRLGTGPATRTDISHLFQRHVPAAKLRAVLTAAELRGVIRRQRDDTGGRPKDTFTLAH